MLSLLATLAAAVAWASTPAPAATSADAITPTIAEGTPVKRTMLGGYLQSTPVILHDVAIGPWRMNAHGRLAQSPASFDTVDGLIGSDFLQLFRMTLDEAQGNVYLTPLDLREFDPY